MGTASLVLSKDGIVVDEASRAPEPVADQPGKRPRRLRVWLIALAMISAIVGGLVILINHAPDYLARYLARNYFQGLNIDTSGVETIDISPLQGEVNFGPVTFRGAESEAGEVGRLGLKINVKRLFHKQALLEAVVVEGIRIDIHQAVNGEISINGIPLTRILAEQAAQQTGEPAPQPMPSTPPAPGAPPSIAERLPWGAGLDRLQLRDSRIVFTSSRGGQATIEVKSLDLEGFATWAPNDPGRFRLDGDLNRIHIAMTGTATPFATSIAVDAKLDITGIELAKIEKFAGPLGFNPNAGSADVTVESKGSVVTADGRIEAQLQGQAKLNGIDLASPDFGALRLADATVGLNDVRLNAQANGRVDVAGDASIDLSTLALRLDDGTEVGADKATIGLPAFAVSVPVRAAPTFAITPQLDVQALRLGGPSIQGTLATVGVRLSAFVLDLVADGTPLTATGSVTASDIKLTVPGQEPIDITLSALQSNLDAVRFAFPADSTLIDGAFSIDAANPLVTILAAAKKGSTQPPMRFGAASLVGTLPTLAVDAGTVTKLKISAPALDLDRFQMELPLAAGSDLQLRTGPLQLKSMGVDLIQGESMRVGGRLRLSSPELAIAMREATREGRTTTNVDLRRLVLDLPDFTYREAGPVSGLAMKGRLASDRIEARIGGARGDLAQAIDLAGLDLAIHELAMEDGGRDPEPMRARLDLGFRSLEAMLPGVSLPMTARIHDVRLMDAEIDVADPGAYGFDRLAIGGFDVSLTRRAAAAQSEQAAAPSPPAKTEAKAKDVAPRTWPPAGLPTIRIGQMGLLESSTISMLDQTLSPPAIVTIHLDALSLSNVDSTKPSARADLRLKARLNDALMTLDGWALPFKPHPDFDIRAKVNELALPAVNPYLAPQVGLDITAGKLIFDAEGKAEGGQLTGELRPTVAGLRFADRTGAGSDQVSRSIGMPLSTIIGLLEDADGTIALTLPVEGDLLSPDFDYSSVMWSGLYRVLRALITSPFKLVSASVSLLTAGDGGAGEAAAAGSPMLTPLAFAPGETGLSSSAHEAIVGLRQMLKDRPRMRLTLCGVATSQDLDQLIGNVRGREREVATAKALPRLPELARARMIQVRDALTEGGGADRRGQVPVCPEPRVAPSDPGVPRVELGF